MSVTVVNGGQWGDEGKGKIVDFLVSYYDAGIRGTAGDNAGHTVEYLGRQLKFRIAPSTLAFGKPSFVGDDVLVNPEVLVKEIDEFRDLGTDVKGLLFVSRNVHVVLPYHRYLDECVEEGKRAIGTTRRGIGPAIADKVNRVGIRMEEFMEPQLFRKRLRENVEHKNRIVEALYPDKKAEDFGGGPAFEADEIFQQYAPLAEKIKPFVTDTVAMVHRMLENGNSLLVEGAQGSMNDLVYGTYPYVTSSRPIASGVLAGTGVGPTTVEKVISVIKPYQTRVGTGPVFCEITGPTAEEVRSRGREYGTVTERPRRVMWFDSVVVNYTSRVNGTTSFALTKLDVLDTLDEIRIGTAYRSGGSRTQEFPAQTDLSRYEAEYISVPGWKESTHHARSYLELPANARHLVEKLEELTNIPVSVISVGPDREQTIVVREEELR